MLDEKNNSKSKDKTFFDPRLHLQEILLRRDNAEFRRLLSVQKQEVPTIELRSYLFDRFMQFYATVGSLLDEKLRGDMLQKVFKKDTATMGEYRSLQMQACLTRFAFWLHRVEENILSSDEMAKMSSGGDSDASGSSSHSSYTEMFVNLKDTLDRDFQETLVKEVLRDLSDRISIENSIFTGWVEGAADLVQLAQKGLPEASIELRDRIYLDVVQQFPDECQTAAYHLSQIQLREKKTMWQGAFGPDHKRKHMKTYLQIAQTALRDRSSRAQNRLNVLKQTILNRFRYTFAPYLGDLATQNGGTNSQLDFRVQEIFDKRIELLESVVNESVFAKEISIEEKGINIFADKIQSIIGQIGITERMFETGRVLMSNGRAQKFAKAFTKKERQLWGTSRLQGYRVSRCLRTTYPVIERKGENVLSKLKKIDEEIQKNLGEERIDFLTRP